MRKAIYFALGAAAIVLPIVVITWPLPYFLLLVAVGDFLGLPCGGLC